MQGSPKDVQTISPPLPVDVGGGPPLALLVALPVEPTDVEVPVAEALDKADVLAWLLPMPPAPPKPSGP